MTVSNDDDDDDDGKENVVLPAAVKQSGRKWEPQPVMVHVHPSSSIWPHTQVEDKTSWDAHKILNHHYHETQILIFSTPHPANKNVEVSTWMEQCMCRSKCEAFSVTALQKKKKKQTFVYLCNMCFTCESQTKPVKVSSWHAELFQLLLHSIYPGSTRGVQLPL